VLQNNGEVAGVVLLYASYISCYDSKKVVKIGVHLRKLSQN